MAKTNEEPEFCEVCGNEMDFISSVCKFCGSKRDHTKDNRARGRFSHRTINLESGRPNVEVALNRLEGVVADSLRNGVDVVTFIHGYGSSGKGGAIRTECRKMLEYKKSRSEIKDYIFGEDFNKRMGRVKSLLRRFPELQSDRNLNRGNRGITLVILG